MDGFVVVGKSGIMMKPRSAIGMVMTPSMIKSPEKWKCQSIVHEVKITSKLTLPSSDASSTIKATIDTLHNRPCEHEQGQQRILDLQIATIR